MFLIIIITRPDRVLMFQKQKRESSPDSIGEPINGEELVEVPMKQRHTTTTVEVCDVGKSSNSLDYNSCDLPSASAAPASPSSASASAAATTAVAGSSSGVGGDAGQSCSGVGGDAGQSCSGVGGGGGQSCSGVGGGGGQSCSGVGGGSTSVVSVGCDKPNSSTSSVVVNLPTSYPNSEMDYGSASYPPSPSLSSNNDKPQVRITFL